MRHPPEVKEKVCELYRAGTPRLQIAEKMGMKIPPTTIYNWTKFVSLGVACVECGNKVKRKHLNQRYCSGECKAKAKYRRVEQRKREGITPRICKMCNKSFNPRNDKRHQYCTKKCQDKAAKQRRRNKTADANAE